MVTSHYDGSNTVVKLFINGELQESTSTFGDYGDPGRYLMIGVGSEANVYDGAIGPEDYLQFYAQDIVAGSGYKTTSPEVPYALHSNSEGFAPVGEVHGDLLVDGTIKARQVDANKLLAKQFIVQSGGSIENSGGDFEISIDGISMKTFGAIPKSATGDLSNVPQAYTLANGSTDVASLYGSGTDLTTFENVQGSHQIFAYEGADTQAVTIRCDKIRMQDGAGNPQFTFFEEDATLQWPAVRSTTPSFPSIGAKIYLYDTGSGLELRARFPSSDRAIATE